MGNGFRCPLERNKKGEALFRTRGGGYIPIKVNPQFMANKTAITINPRSRYRVTGSNRGRIPGTVMKVRRKIICAVR